MLVESFDQINRCKEFELYTINDKRIWVLLRNQIIFHLNQKELTSFTEFLVVPLEEGMHINVGADIFCLKVLVE